MEGLIRAILYCVFVLLFFWLIWFLIKKLQNWSNQRLAANLTPDIKEYLRASQNRRRAEQSDLEQLKKTSISKIIFIILVLLFLGIIMGISGGFSGGFLIPLSITFLIAFGIPLGILLLNDKRRLTPSYDGGLWIEKAYILNAVPYRGYNLVIAYFDFVENEIRTLSIHIDSSDVARRLQAGDYIDIVLSIRKSRLKYSCVIKG